MARSAAMTIAKNSLALLASKLTILGFGFIFVVFAARQLGVEEFGKWALTRGFFDFALNLCAAGLNTVLIRDVARNPENTSRYLTTSAVFAMGPLAIVSLGVVMIARASGYAEDTQLAIYLIILALLPAAWSTMVEGAFVGREKAEYVGSVTLGENIFRTSLSFIVILMGYGVVALTIVLLVSKVLMLLAYLLLFHLRAGRLSWVLDWSFMRQHFNTWQVFAAENWMANIYLGTGGIILSLFHGERAVGAYAAADRVLGWVGLFSHSYTNAVYPHMSRLFGESNERLQRLIENSVRFMLVFIIPFGVLVTVFADRIVLFLYTEAYVEAIPLMQVLVWIPVLRFLNTFFSRVLFARREQGRALFLAAVALAVYLAAALALVPAWAGLGMAWAKVAGIGSATAVFFWFVFRSDQILRPLGNLGRIALAAVIAGAVAMALRGLPLVLTLGIAGLLYLGLLLAFRVASTRDLVQLQKLAAMGLQKISRRRARDGVERVEAPMPPAESYYMSGSDMQNNGAEEAASIGYGHPTANGRRLRVAFLSFDFGEYSVRTASALAKEATVLLMVPRRLASPHLRAMDPSVEFRPFDRPRFREPIKQLRMIAALVRQIAAFRPDVIHFQGGHLWFNLALPLLRRYPLVITVHNPRHHVGDKSSQRIPQPVMDFGYRRADQVIVHGSQLKEAVVEQLGIAAETVHVVPHITMGDEAAGSEVEEDGRSVLFFGRIWEYKGLDYLIKSEPLITAQVPDARIIIAGQGEDFSRYRRLMAHPERFEVYNEYVPDDRRAELFRRASIVVLPYIEATQSGVIPVAYTFSKPVVATTVGALPEAVEDGRTGYLVPPRDERALAQAVVRLLTDEDLRRRMGANGKRKIDADSSPEAVTRQTLVVYHQAIEARRGIRPLPVGQGLDAHSHGVIDRQAAGDESSALQEATTAVESPAREYESDADSDSDHSDAQGRAA